MLGAKVQRKITMPRNCIFGALSHQIHGDEFRYPEIREMVAVCIENHPNRFEGAAGDQQVTVQELPTYIRTYAEQTLNWGGNEAVIAMTISKRACVEIHYRTRRTPRVVTDELRPTNEVLTTYRLGFDNVNHYWSLVPIEHIRENDLEELLEFQDTLLQDNSTSSSILTTLRSNLTAGPNGSPNPRDRNIRPLHALQTADTESNVSMVAECCHHSRATTIQMNSNVDGTSCTPMDVTATERRIEEGKKLSAGSK